MRTFRKRRARHLQLGRRGETIACRLLHELGLTILARNYVGRNNEIDIVAREDTQLCFVEVKTRHRAVHSRPAEAAGRAKQRGIVRAAHGYLVELGRPRVPYRFDIVEVVLANRRLQDLRYWPSAFTESDRHR